jgi:hypothetical protein
MDPRFRGDDDVGGGSENSSNQAWQYIYDILRVK